MKRSIALALLMATVGITAAGVPRAEAVIGAATRSAARPAAAPAGGVYPQYRLASGQSARWISEQMPVRVWVSRGLSLDQIVDPATGAPVTNTANTKGWPDAVMNVMQTPDEVSRLPIAEGFSEAEWQAAVQGINSWKFLEKEGLVSYELVENPEDADIYVFWTNHFVNKLGLALFENDIRGYTAKYLLPTAAVMAAIQRNDLEMVRRSRKPVVILLRTAESNGQPIALEKMKASAAHEFGHALGIDGHSTNPADLMSIYYGRGVVSANDAATVRYLYKHGADLMP